MFKRTGQIAVFVGASVVSGCASLAGLRQPAEDAATCAAAHAGANSACDADAVDPLADLECADALRVVVRACRSERRL